MQVRVWGNPSGPVHYYKPGKLKSLCGEQLVGTNKKTEGARQVCRECIKGKNYG